MDFSDSSAFVALNPDDSSQGADDGDRVLLPSSQILASNENEVVSCDPGMRGLLQRALRIARSDASVMVSGESGTGKEVVARYIHRNSPRCNGPFVGVNCAAIPEHLLESELFGHERGAFSGAITQRIGKLEAAQNGTILLDEVSEMDRRLQAKLLRAIQEREVDRIGGRQPVRLNVRIIATSNADLEAEIARGAFRSDLYFRLNVVAVRIPSLRDRPDDILPLASHFLRKFAEGSQARRRLSPEALAALTSHSWPGNVRELENTIHRAIVLSAAEVIGPDLLEMERPMSSIQPISQNQTGPHRTAQPLYVVERDAILNSLHITSGNRTKAASMLGLSIRALRNKLSQYAAQGITVPSHSKVQVL